MKASEFRYVYCGPCLFGIKPKADEDTSLDNELELARVDRNNFSFYIAVKYMQEYRMDLLDSECHVALSNSSVLSEVEWFSNEYKEDIDKLENGVYANRKLSLDWCVLPLTKDFVVKQYDDGEFFDKFENQGEQDV